MSDVELIDRVELELDLFPGLHRGLELWAARGGLGEDLFAFLLDGDALVAGLDAGFQGDAVGRGAGCVAPGIPLLLIEMPRYPDLQGSFNTPWKNLQGIIKIIQKYQKQGQLKNESPLACLTALIGPILVSQMIHHANLNLPAAALDTQAHVDSFLNGRKI